MIRIALSNDLRRQAAHRAIDAAKDGDEVSISAPSKTRDQEAAYHSTFSEVAAQCSHLNRQFSSEGWKRLLVDQFCREMLEMPDLDPDIRDNLKSPVEMVPSLDGRAIVAIGIQTRKFKRKTATAFLEWLNAFCAENGVKRHAPERYAA